MPSSNSLRHPETERYARTAQGETLISTTCSTPVPHPALIALAKQLGRVAAREAFAQMHATPRADCKPSRH